MLFAAACHEDWHLLGRWYILVLAIEVVFPAKLTRSRFVTFLLPRSTMITCLRSANLFAPYWLANCTCILAHVRARRIRTLIILGSRWRRWWVELLCTVVMCRAYGVAVPIRHMTIRAMLWVHSPWTLVGAMIHRWWLRFDVGTDTGSGALWLWLSGRLRSRGCPVG